MREKLAKLERRFTPLFHSLIGSFLIPDFF